MNLDLSGKPRSDNRMLAIGLGVAAAALLMFAAFSRSWVARPAANDIGFGPMGCQNCAIFDGASGGDMSNGAFIEAVRAMDPDSARTTSSAFAPMGWATFVVLLLSGLGLLAAAGLAYAKQRRDLPIAPTTIALLGLMISLITACVFVATKPGGPGFVGVSMGFWAYGIGAVMGIAAAQMLAKLLRPVDPDLLEGAMNPDHY